jgi:hypothetical protein
VGVPANTVYSSPPAPKVHPVPDPEIGPQWVAVSPMLQLQFEPGSMPAASTSATNVAIGGTTGTGCTGTATGAGATVMAGAFGVEAAVIAGGGSDGAGVVVVVVPGTAPVVSGVVLVRRGVEGGADEARWDPSATTVVTAKVEARHTMTRRTARRRPNEDARRGVCGGVLSTMC